MVCYWCFVLKNMDSAPIRLVLRALSLMNGSRCIHHQKWKKTSQLFMQNFHALELSKIPKLMSLNAKTKPYAEKFTRAATINDLLSTLCQLKKEKLDFTQPDRLDLHADVLLLVITPFEKEITNLLLRLSKIVVP